MTSGTRGAGGTILSKIERARCSRRSSAATCERICSPARAPKLVVAAIVAPMQLGMIGLGRMGANMARRLLRGGHSCVVYDRSADAVKALASEGAQGVEAI